MRRGDPQRQPRTQLLQVTGIRTGIQGEYIVKKNITAGVVLALLGSTGVAAAAPKAASATSGGSSQLKPCTSVAVDAPALVTLGKSTVVKLSMPVARMAVGGRPTTQVARMEDSAKNDKKEASAPSTEVSDGVADVDITMLSPSELFVLGKRAGAMNLILQGSDSRCMLKDIVVTLDIGALQGKLRDVMPDERDIKVAAAENTLVLSGTISSAMRLEQILSLAASYGDSKKIVNLMRVTAPSQVMLEVKIAEVSKTLLDRFGLDFSRLVTSANGSATSVISGIIGGGAGVLGRFSPNIAGGAIAGRAGIMTGTSSSIAGAAAAASPTSTAATLLGIDAEKKDGLVRVLAEPNIMAISGQQASFLSGGKIFIPVAQNNTSGGTTITLEEKEFGVGLKFMPTVLDGSRVNLKLVSEVSELSQTGSPFTTFNGITAVLPSMATRRADTTVQLNDGQSFAIAGLIRSNVNESISRFPGLGEIPILGALFRSTEFQNNQTELIFVITPRLVKPVAGDIALPTDNHVPPNRGDVLFMGSAEGRGQSKTTGEQAPGAATK
jgi:pilus assembly protein CpaC